MLRWLPTCIRRYDLVIHAAARGPNRRAIDTQPSNFAYNTLLDATMFEWFMRTDQRHLVYISSCAVYTPNIGMMSEDGDTFSPFDTYGQTKAHGERLAAAAIDAGQNVTVVRPFSGYGEDQSVDFPFRAFVERAKRKEDPFTIWGNAQQVRDWIHVDDIVNGTLALVEHGKGVLPPMNLCTGRRVSMLA